MSTKSFSSNKFGLSDLSTLKENYINFKKEEASPIHPQNYILKIDDNGDGEIDFEEFVTLMERQTNYVEESEEDLVLRAFKSFDKDHDGKITNYEFKYILTQMGDKFSQEELDTLFKECDLDINGQLDYQDFINFWKKY